MADYAKDVLVTTDWLAEQLDDESVVVAEVDENPDLYDEGHIAGAVKLHWRDDLQDPVERDLVDRGASSTCSVSVGSRTSRRSSSMATGTTGSPPTRTGTSTLWPRGRRHPRRRAAEVDRRGPRAHDGLPSRQRVDYRARERNETLRAYRDAVTENIGSPDKVLVDVRSPQEFSGELVSPPGYEQEGARRAGHIPSAQSVLWAQAVRDDGTFRRREELAELYESKGVMPGKDVTAYCRIGERSAHTWGTSSTSPPRKVRDRRKRADRHESRRSTAKLLLSPGRRRPLAAVVSLSA